MENKEKNADFNDTLYLKSPRFLSYFTLVVLTILFVIYAVEQIIDPSGIFFIQISLMVTGIYMASIAFKIKSLFVF